MYRSLIRLLTIRRVRGQRETPVTSSRLYDEDMYRFDRPEPSYWEATAGESAPHCAPLEGDQQCEVAIVGGGYSGLSAEQMQRLRGEFAVYGIDSGRICVAALNERNLDPVTDAIAKVA